MARPLRIEFPGAWYHVTSRGNERKSIFSDDSDRRKFLEIVASSVESYQVQVHAYALMANHFHLLVMTPKANLQSFMQRLNTAYTVYFNRRHRRAGHLLQGRYKAILIDVDSHLAEISRYLHLNPVRIQKFSNEDIASKKKLLSNYPWSSYPGYITLKKRHAFVTYEVVLSVVGGKDDASGRRRYREFVLAGIAKDMNITYWKDVRGQVVVGSDEFVNRILKKVLKEKREKEAGKKVHGYFNELFPPVAVEPVAEAVGEKFKVEAAELLRKRSKHRQARRFLLALCYDLFGGRESLSELGAKLGPVSAAALCRNRKVIEDEMNHDKGLGQKYRKMLNELRQ